MAQDFSYAPGSRYNSTNPIILNRQTPTGLPRSAVLVSVTDPINPSVRTSDRLRHFFDGIYSLAPESHLSILLKVLIGEAGIGGLTKQYAVARQQSMLLTTKYGDLDKFYGAFLGLRRLVDEQLDITPYYQDATPEQWDAIDARDAAYRARIETYVRALPLGGTPSGMAALGQAVLGVDCRILETYLLLDETGVNPSGNSSADGRTYGDIETEFIYYSSMIGTYADIEGGFGTFGRTTNANRSEFIVVPKRPISLEENYELLRVLSRFKPANSLLTINPLGVEIHRLVTLRQVYADSVYWEVAAKVLPGANVAAGYPNIPLTGLPVPLPRPAFSGYQGEAWSYNADIGVTKSFTQTPAGAVKDRYNYERIKVGKIEIDFSPNKALIDHSKILMGRAVSDGILSVSPYESRQEVTVL